MKFNSIPEHENQSFSELVPNTGIEILRIPTPEISMLESSTPKRSCINLVPVQFGAVLFPHGQRQPLSWIVLERLSFSRGDKRRAETSPFSPEQSGSEQEQGGTVTFWLLVVGEPFPCWSRAVIFLQSRAELTLASGNPCP